VHRLAHAAKKKHVKRDMLQVLLVTIIIGVFMVQALSLWTGSESKTGRIIIVASTNKSTFLPGEVAGIALAMLDEKGKSVCGESVTIGITGPNGMETLLSTKDGTVAATECNTGLSQNYYAEYMVAEPGIYDAHIIAPAGETSLKFSVEKKYD
jgi:hypothetical protein